MSIKGLLFDFNGTLFFDSDIQLDSFKRCYARYGIIPPDDDYIFKNIFGMQNTAIFKQYFFEDATEEQIADFINFKEKTYISLCREQKDRLHLCEGAPELLDYLKKKGIPVCIATGSERENVEFYFECLGLGRWFTYDTVVYTDGTFRGKPYPDIYEIAAKRLGLDPSQCAVFEDAGGGMRAANAAGAGKTVALYESWLPSPIPDDVKVDAVYHSLTDIKGLLSDLGIN
ncbi:MAG: HAD family phosphatase [Ruminococcaceae bacterium]|nr:HAD family phosphatase [Oscillospiraceae bacterium]